MPVEVVEMSTREPDLARAALSEGFTPARPLTLSGIDAGFACDLWSADAGQLRADRVRLSGQLRGVLAPVDCFMAQTGVRGRCHYRVGRQEMQLGTSGAMRYPTDTAVVAELDDLEVWLLRLPLAVIERVAAERSAVPRGDVRFDALTAVTPQAQRNWHHLMTFTHAQLSGPAAAAGSPLVAAALADLIAATALVTFPNTTMSASATPRQGWVAPAVVRRAVAHIEAHADQALTVSDIARAAGVGPRALQLAFARHLGATPTAYLRRVRLQRAHRELQAGDASAGDTVAAIARRWGWVNTGRFATAYRAAYGVAPSHALRT